LPEKKKEKSSIMGLFNKKTAPSSASTRPVNSIKGTIGKKKGKSDKNEIFVDIFEKLSVLFNSEGNIINSSIDGVIQMKSYLKGNPGLRLVLNDDLVVGKGASNNEGSVVLDDCAFHESVDTRDFEFLKTLAITPPDGEFLVMNYRINGDYQTPFQIYPSVSEVTPYKIHFTLRIKATCPSDKTASQVIAKFNLPKDTADCRFEIPQGIKG
jgi:AP-4 complex subunit mu-1